MLSPVTTVPHFGRKLLRFGLKIMFLNLLSLEVTGILVNKTKRDRWPLKPGRLLRGNDKKTGRTEEIEPFKRNSYLCSLLSNTYSAKI